AHAFSSPKPLSTGKFDDNPAFVLIGKSVLVSAVGGVSMLIDHITHYFHCCFCRGGTFHSNAREVRVLWPSLPVRGHIDEFFARIRPHIACSNVLLVETTVG